MMTFITEWLVFFIENVKSQVPIINNVNFNTNSLMCEEETDDFCLFFYCRFDSPFQFFFFFT